MSLKGKFEKKQLKELLGVTIGSLILAISLNSILLPNHLVVGGANGIGVILHALFGWNIAMVLLVINLPLLILCFVLLGKKTGLKTIYGSLVYPFFVGVTANLPVLTHQLFLAMVFGGVVTGIGLGIEFRAKASTGGTAIISQIVHKYAKIPLGVAVSIVDGLVILGALIVFPVETVLFSLICLFLIGRTIDAVQTGLGRFKNLLVISEQTADLRAVLVNELDKGVTVVPIEGGFQNQGRLMLMVTIKAKDYSAVKERLLEVDEQAFIVAMSASEVHGKGFSLQRVLDHIDS